ncbi:MAG: hypothetical protein RIT43_614 [Bacteroidota bacterium]|jgi:uncharacterized protein YbaP (TraB family)
MKRFLFFLVLLLGEKGYTQTAVREHRLLWEITGNGLTGKSYLFGSLHSNDKRVFNFSDSTYLALVNSQAVVLETDLFSLFPEWDTRTEEPAIFIDNSGKPYTGNDRPTKTLYGDENGMPQFMDAFFQQYCYNAGKKFYQLEDPSDQLKTMKKWIQNEKAIFFVDPTEGQEKLIDFYLKGDITSLDKLMRSNLSSSEGMYEEIIVARNQKMVQKLDSIMRLSPSFCAVGAGHLAGELGMINLLRLKGYRLRPVGATFSEPSVDAKRVVRSPGNFKYYHEPSHLLAVFPGKPSESITSNKNVSLMYRELGQGNTYAVEIFPLDESNSIPLREQAAILIASPDESTFECKTLDDGTEICEGIGDTYPEGFHWIRLIQSDTHLVVMKAYGGNKFMNSNRPKSFFDKVGFE